MSDQPQPALQAVPDLIRSEKGAHALYRFAVTSGSMAPILKPGDHILIQPAVFDRIRPGDIVILQRSSDLVTHRLIQTNPTTCLVKGDAFRLADPPFLPSALLGLVLAVEHQSKQVNLRSRPWIACGKFLAWLARLSQRVRVLSWPFAMITRLVLLIAYWLTYS